MWNDAASFISSTHRVIDIYEYKKEWCHDQYVDPYNYCFACAVAVRLSCSGPGLPSWYNNWEDGGEGYCKCCPLDWGSNGDANGEYMCEFNKDSPDGSWIGHGLWMQALEMYDNPAEYFTWEEQYEICKKIADLPINSSIYQYIED